MQKQAKKKKKKKKKQPHTPPSTSPRSTKKPTIPTAGTALTTRTAGLRTSVRALACVCHHMLVLCHALREVGRITMLTNTNHRKE